MFDFDQDQLALQEATAKMQHINNNQSDHSALNTSSSSSKKPVILNVANNTCTEQLPISKKHTKVTSNDYCKIDYFCQRSRGSTKELSINELIREELKLKNLFITLVKLSALFALITLYNELYLYRFDLVSLQKTLICLISSNIIDLSGELLINNVIMKHSNK